MATTITLPLIPTGIYNFTVNWGDGTSDIITSYTSTSKTHTYLITGGTKTIYINGTISGWTFNNGGDKTKISSITQWGDLRLGNSGGYFYGCSNLILTGVTDILNLSGTTSLNSMFRSCTGLTTVNNMNSWDVSNVTDMGTMLNGATNFNQPIGNWDVGKVTFMNTTFSNATNFNQPLSGWNVSKVTNMTSMFIGATNFNQDISNWNVSGVTAMINMFNGAINFNQPIGNWNVSNVTNMGSMFNNATNFNQPLSGWNVSKVINTSSMFNRATNFNQPIGNWNVSKVTNMGNMFLSATTFNQDLGNWDVSSANTMSNILSNTSLSVDNYNSLLTGWTGWIGGTATKSVRSNISFSVGTTKYSGNTTAEDARNYLVNIKTWTITDGGPSYSTPNTFITTWFLSIPTTITLPLESGGTYNFTVNWGDGSSDVITSYSYSGITHNYSTSGTKTIYIDGIINGWSFNNGGDKTKIRTIKQWGDLKLGNSGGYFYGCSSLNLNTLTDTLNLSGTTNLTNMFNLCLSLSVVNNINSWDVSNVTDITGMFSNTFFNQPIDNWNVSNVTGMSNTFYATNFNQPLSGWNVSNVTDMSFMFSYTPFNRPIGNWNVSNVTNMGGMFDSAGSFNQPLSGWNVSNVTNMNGMFLGASNFNQPIGNWDVSNVTDMGIMFAGTSNFNQPLSGWNVSNVYNMAYMFYNTPFNQDISNWNVSNVNDMTAFMEGKTSLDYNYQYYNNLINSWSQLPLQNNVVLDMGTINYSLSGIIPKQNIIDTYNWTINDGGLIFSSTTNTFISTWDTTYGSGDLTITLPLTSNGTYNFISYWGDGSYDIITSYNQSEVTHTYSVGGTKTIFIEGLIDGWSFNYTGDYEKITSITQWGNLKLGNNGDYFNGCFNLNLENVTDILNLSGTTNLNYMFSECNSLTTVNNINSWDVSNVITMEAMFVSSNFNQSLSNWDVSNVQNMISMFNGSPNFNQDLGHWNVSGVTNMSYMLDGTSLSRTNYNSLLTGWTGWIGGVPTKSVQSNVPFSVGTTQYSSGTTANDARNYLVTGKTWTITDGGGI